MNTPRVSFKRSQVSHIIDAQTLQDRALREMVVADVLPAVPSKSKAYFLIQPFFLL